MLKLCNICSYGGALQSVLSHQAVSPAHGKGTSGSSDAFERDQEEALRSVTQVLDGPSKEDIPNHCYESMGRYYSILRPQAQQCPHEGDSEGNDRKLGSPLS